VTDATGTTIGVITDLRCVQDGPLRGTNATLRIDALLVSRHHTGSVLATTADAKDRGLCGSSWRACIGTCGSSRGPPSPTKDRRSG